MAIDKNEMMEFLKEHLRVNIKVDTESSYSGDSQYVTITATLDFDEVEISRTEDSFYIYKS